MLQAVNLHKTFHNGANVKVINGIDMVIDKGDMLMITGKSGSGKSTLLYLLSALEQPTEGQVLLNGINICSLNDTDISKLRRHSIGFIYQFYNLIYSLNVIDNITLPLRMDKALNEQRKKEIAEIIEMLELNGKENTYPYQLSGGQQQRVAIARALAIKPDIIFADEPTGNLDSKTSDGVLEILNNLNTKNDVTIVMVTHDEQIAKKYGSRRINISDGKIDI